MSEQEFFVRDTRQPGHFWADNEVLDVFGERLGYDGFAIYLALCRHATNGTGECKISIRRLARMVAMSTGGAFNALTKILQLGLARQLDPGTRSSPAVYALADIKVLVNPEIAKLRLSGLGVHAMNTTPQTCSPHEQGVHGVNGVFTPRTRNKERERLYTRLDLNPPNPPFAKGGEIDLTNRDRRRLAKYIENLRKIGPDGLTSRISAETTFTDLLEVACADLMLPFEAAKRALPLDPLWQKRLCIEKAT